MKVEQSYSMLDKQYQRRRFENISRVVNGGLDFGTPPPVSPTTVVPTVNNGIGPGNISGFWVNVTTPATANTTFTVTHNLGRIPNGILVFSVDQPGAVIQSVNKSSWTTKMAQFACNVASVSLLGFVT
jgi:hypothetical protein